MNASTAPSPTAQASPELPIQSSSLLAGVNILLEGPSGTGKTYSLGTAVDSGVETFVLFTESGIETLLGYWTDQGKPVPSNLHWHVLSQASGSFEAMAKMANTINTYTMESLFKMTDPDRAKHNQYVDLLRVLSNFPDDRTGTKFGPVDSWGPDKLLAIDSLSGINPIAFSLVVGAKPLKDQRDWGTAMDLIEKLVRQLTGGCKCHVVLIAHIERETDLVQGGVKITVATLGNKLAPKIVPMFSDVIMSVRKGKEFSWTTADPQAELKARNLEIADGIKPTFTQIFDKWKSRGGAFSPTVKR